MEREIPIYAFVERDVHSDFRSWQANESRFDAPSEMGYLAVDSMVAAHVFDFITYLRDRRKNNFLFSYDANEDVRVQLREQIGSLFRHLLQGRTLAEGQDQIARRIDEGFALVQASLASVAPAANRPLLRLVSRCTYLFEVLDLAGLTLATARDFESLDSALASVHRQLLLVADADPNDRVDALLVRSDDDVALELRNHDLTEADVEEDWGLLTVLEPADLAEASSILREAVSSRSATCVGVRSASQEHPPPLDEIDRFFGELRPEDAPRLSHDLFEAFPGFLLEPSGIADSVWPRAGVKLRVPQWGSGFVQSVFWGVRGSGFGLSRSSSGDEVEFSVTFRGADVVDSFARMGLEWIEPGRP